MEILAYGEDALTLWAIQNKLPAILHGLGDSSASSQCQAFFRPSFGRSGGNRSSGFGEFDFIILSSQRLYLGESKWDRSSEPITSGLLALRAEQQLRHDIFKFYVEEWAFGSYPSWRDFRLKAKSKLERRGINKPIAPEGSLLAANLQTVLRIIREHFSALPDIRDVLLYLHRGTNLSQLPRRAGKDFEVVSIDYSESTLDNFIKMVI